MDEKLNIKTDAPKKEYPYPQLTINLRKTKKGNGLTLGVFFKATKNGDAWSNYYIDFSKYDAFLLNKEQQIYPISKMNDLKDGSD